MADVNLTIDGHKITAPAGTLVVEAAKTIGIEIPVFCYHHKLDTVECNVSSPHRGEVARSAGGAGATAPQAGRTRG